MKYRIEHKTHWWVEERNDGWYVGKRTDGVPGFTMYGPVGSKLVAEIVQADLLEAEERAFEILLRNRSKPK